MNELAHLAGELARGRISRRDFMGRASALGITIATASLLADRARAQEPQKGGDLVVGITGGSSTDTLDPTRATASMHANLNFQWGNCLVEVDSQGQAIPELAESWEPSDDAKSWAFQLRQGVTFHNGKELDADDVVASINLHRGEGTQSGAAGYMKSLTDVKADGKHKVIFTLDSGNADLPYLLADYHLIIMPKGGDPASGMGTGPYVIEEFEPGVRSVGVRNESYFKEGRAHVDSIELLAINDVAARTSAVQTGQITVMERVDPKTVSLLEKAGTVTLHRAAGGGHYLLVMRCDTPPFDNIDLRLALKHAINRDDIVSKVLRGLGQVGNDHPIPRTDPFFSDRIPQRPYDPEKAKFHFEKAGISGPVQLSTSEAAFSGAVDTAVLFKEHASKAGITIDVIREPADGYWDVVWMKKPFCLSYWGGRATADLMLTVAYKSDAAWNDSFWKRPNFDTVLLEARAELDRARRAEMYHQLELMIHEDGGVIVPMFNDFVDAADASVQNYELSPQLGLCGMRVHERVWLSA